MAALPPLARSRIPPATQARSARSRLAQSGSLTRHISRGHVICPLLIIRVRLSYPNTDRMITERLEEANRMSDMNLVDYLLTQKS